MKGAFEAEAKKSGKSSLLITAAVPVGPENIKNGYDVPNFVKYLDFINVMAYDFHGQWESKTGHNSPLYASSSDKSKLSVDDALKLWVQLGAPKKKLVVGMATYGRSFTLANAAQNGLGSPTNGGGAKGEFTREGGMLSYYEICQMLKNGAKNKWDDEMKVPYLVQNNQWVGFDDEKSLRNKVKYVRDNGYGGAMVWTLDFDDFRGSVCNGNVKYPLISAIRYLR